MSWAQVRRVILGRDNEACVRCGYPANDVHHRIMKGMGGTRNEEVAYGPANLISLCRECHVYVHAHPAKSYEEGFLVHSWSAPGEVPVVTKFGNLSLRKDGTSELGKCDRFLFC